TSANAARQKRISVLDSGIWLHPAPTDHYNASCRLGLQLVAASVIPVTPSVPTPWYPGSAACRARLDRQRWARDSAADRLTRRRNRSAVCAWERSEGR